MNAALYEAYKQDAFTLMKERLENGPMKFADPVGWILDTDDPTAYTLAVEIAGKDEVNHFADELDLRVMCVASTFDAGQELIDLTGSGHDLAQIPRQLGQRLIVCVAGGYAGVHVVEGVRDHLEKMTGEAHDGETRLSPWLRPSLN